MHTYEREVLAALSHLPELSAEGVTAEFASSLAQINSAALLTSPPSNLRQLRPRTSTVDGAASMLNPQPPLSTARGSHPSSEASIMGTAAPPGLTALLHHPVCLELLKDELVRLQCVELVSFYLLAFRYRCLGSAKLRRVLSGYLYDAFIAEGSEQQVNLSTRHREAISSVVLEQRRGDGQAAPAALFIDAEREMLQLIDTNVMKHLSGTQTHRMITIVYHALPFETAITAIATSRQPGAAATLRDRSQSNSGD